MRSWEQFFIWRLHRRAYLVNKSFCADASLPHPMPFVEWIRFAFKIRPSNEKSFIILSTVSSNSKNFPKYVSVSLRSYIEVNTLPSWHRYSDAPISITFDNIYTLSIFICKHFDGSVVVSNENEWKISHLYRQALYREITGKQMVGTPGTKSLGNHNPNRLSAHIRIFFWRQKNGSRALLNLELGTRKVLSD